MGILAAGVLVAFAASAGAQVKGAGKSSVTIVKMPAPGPSSPTPKTAGAVSSKPMAAVAGKPPTGGGSFALKLAKASADPAKPGFPDGEYVVEIEASGTAGGDLVGSPLAAAYFIEFTMTGGKCTIHSHPDFSPGSPSCGGMAQPPCGAPEGVGKCSATIWQVAGNILQAAGLVANQPFDARFRIRTNPDPANCATGHLLLAALGVPTPPTSSCRSGIVVGAAGVALATQQ
ncbi:MAG: hypothetical protein KIT14_21030 [bacterium]|nr:hypothetical protein [bacterium]